ncbi:MAG TPA: metal ABC transporter ATP-binding protein [Candidatus Dormibacteraeota bacterium]|nr:metal ABC transporter ATP-binding protein [Candidatus Dormibacteraeota bacterium]
MKPVDPATDAADDLLRLEGISVWLSGRQVLRDVSFSLRAGEVTGLIGSNGTGKTTIFRVILGLQRVSAGRVWIAGEARTGHTPAIGYVPQTVALDPDMPLRARDVVGLGIDGPRIGIPLPSRRRRQAVNEMLESVDAIHFADDRVGRLSGGEQRRILIAHALISRPQLLLLDEPLISLDIRSEQEVVQLLSRIARQQRIAILISAHDMNPLLAAMDRIVYVAGGRAASGATNEVVQTEVLSKLYGRQVDVIRLRDRVLVVSGSEETSAADHEHAHETADPGLV